MPECKPAVNCMLTPAAEEPLEARIFRDSRDLPAIAPDRVAIDIFSTIRLLRMEEEPATMEMPGAREVAAKGGRRALQADFGGEAAHGPLPMVWRRLA